MGNVSVRRGTKVSRRRQPAFNAQAFLDSALVARSSQETLAGIIGTTRSRVNFFLNKFKKRGFIEYDGDKPLKINNSLLGVILHD